MSTTHPQVGAYLDDLARMLADIDPGERDDILASVREHLDAEIGSGDGGDAVVHAALLRLGPPEQVAAEARSGQAGPVQHPGLPSPYGAATPRDPRWTRVAAAACLSTIGLPALAAFVGSLFVTVKRDASAGWPAFMPQAIEAVMWLLFLFPVWLVALVVVLVGRDTSTRTKWFLAALGPTTVIVVLAASLTMPATMASSSDPWSASAFFNLVVLGGLAAVLIWNVVTGRRVWRETGPVS